MNCLRFMRKLAELVVEVFSGLRVHPFAHRAHQILRDGLDEFEVHFRSAPTRGNETTRAQSAHVSRHRGLGPAQRSDQVALRRVSARSEETRDLEAAGMR